MPPFREGNIQVDRKFNGEALRFLRDVGHGHRINIVDASYDIPEGSRIIDFPGSSAEAYEEIIRLIPIEGEGDGKLPMLMGSDKKMKDLLEENEGHPANRAFGAFYAAEVRLNKDGIGDADWSGSDVVRRLDDDDPSGNGFYTIANDPDQPHTFIRTVDDLPFACASLVVGHSQRTE